MEHSANGFARSKHESAWMESRVYWQGVPLHVHHLKYLRGKMIWEVPLFYLVTLCEDCHSKEHGRDLKAK